MREYEDYGYTESTIVCPVCGEELAGDELLYIGGNNEVLGCGCCIASKEAWEYFYELDEIARDRHEDYLVSERLGK